MGRHFEVRAASMASSAKKKSALYMRASREIFVAAKSGIPDPVSNLALRSAIDKFKGQGVPKDVIERAISKAAGNDDQTAYIHGRYEAMGPGGSMIVIDTLTDNVNRAFSEIKTVINKRGARLASVAFNFTETGIFILEGLKKNQIEETLILAEIDVWDVDINDEGLIRIAVAPTEFGNTRDQLQALGVEEFALAEIRLIANQPIRLNEEEKSGFNDLLEALDELQDVQSVYHNVDLND
ncbi:MAG: YebC/PmpR family DNA-binding transcriptional regulator [Bacilli bacterium]